MSELQANAPTLDKNNGAVWHTLEPEQTIEQLQVEPQRGLTDAEAKRRLEQFGSNELVETGIKNPLLILWEQLTDPLVLILLGAAFVSLILGDAKSVVAIMAIVTLNALLGVSQEYNAERAIAALKKMSSPAVRVRRDGETHEIPSTDIVPGDIVLLEAGDIVPADARLIESANLQIQEASLTGESLAVDKNIGAIRSEDIPIGDRHNMTYMGTAITYGRGVACVVHTGMDTELGRIAQLIQEVETDKTPLQRRMAELGTALFYVAIGIVIAATVIGILNLLPIEGDVFSALTTVFIAAVAIAVAVVPEGLPAVVTIALSLGAQRMLRKRALIRKLPAVETLGSVTVICSDKTGTLTENRMTVTVVDVADSTDSIDRIETKTNLKKISDIQNLKPKSATQAVLIASGVLANDAELKDYFEEGNLVIVGDPTEGALLTLGARYGLRKDELQSLLPRVGEVPFSSERKRMSTLHQIDHAHHPTTDLENAQNFDYLPPAPDEREHDVLVFAKGAVDSLLDVCDYVLYDGTIRKMTPDMYERVIFQNNSLAEKGLRVLGMAYRYLDGVPDSNEVEAAAENNLVFTGMVGMIDPPRQEVKDAVARCVHAGIRPVMITGDHPLTAYSIARDLNIVHPDNANYDQDVITGRELAMMDDAELEGTVEHVSVFARVSPEHKLKIVRALQKRGHIVSMTGDGVNDAPALKQADIGVAMGITGTAVSKEASEMVILDDNFATIVDAVEEGRTIYDNVRKFVKYILASNTGEVGVLFLTQIFGMPLPLNTLQILWMNLVTDGLPALALSVEKGEPDSMDRPPHSPRESIFSRGLGWYLLRVGALIGLLGLGVVMLFPVETVDGVTTTQFSLFLDRLSTGTSAAVTEASLAVWGTMIFTTLVLSQMGHALAIRSERDSIFKIGFFSNKAMLGAIGLTTVLQIILIYVPFAQDFFGTTALTLGQLALCFAVSLVTFIGVEIDKRIFGRRAAAAAEVKTRDELGLSQ